MTSLAGRRGGLALALAASGVSGLAVFLNGYAVKHVHATPTAYTSAKNLVAVLALAAVAAGRGRVPAREVGRRRTAPEWLGLAYVGVVGGGLAFALFFEGLAKTSATTAAFVQKSLVIWVIAMAVPLLGERIGPAHWAAVVLLVVGAVALGAGRGGLTAGEGPALVLAATLLWAVEVVVAKHLLASLPSLTVGVTRMGIGTATLLTWLAASGRLAQLAHLDRSAWAWVVLTGLLLAVYVGVWFAALARARAVDVTAVLVAAAFVTAALSVEVQGKTLPHAWGFVLVAVGVGVLVGLWPRSQRARTEAASS
jgi:drug/metabolite transporter (DMT)-like permease